MCSSTQTLKRTATTFCPRRTAWWEVLLNGPTVIQTLFTLTLASAVCLWWERATCGGFIPLWTSASEHSILCSGFTGSGGKTARDDRTDQSVSTCDTSAIEPNTESWWITDHIRSTAINYSVALQPSATRSFACVLDFCLTNREKLMKFTCIYRFQSDRQDQAFFVWSRTIVCTIYLRGLCFHLTLSVSSCESFLLNVPQISLQTPPLLLHLH